MFAYEASLASPRCEVLVDEYTPPGAYCKRLGVRRSGFGGRDRTATRPRGDAERRRGDAATRRRGTWRAEGGDAARESRGTWLRGDAATRHASHAHNRNHAGIGAAGRWGHMGNFCPMEHDLENNWYRSGTKSLRAEKCLRDHGAGCGTGVAGVWHGDVGSRAAALARPGGTRRAARAEPLPGGTRRAGRAEPLPGGTRRAGRAECAGGDARRAAGLASGGRGGLAEEDFGFRVALDRDRLELAGGLAERDPDDVGAAQRHH
jgi:hypothetical protein